VVLWICNRLMDKDLEEFLKTIDKSTFSNEPFLQKVEKPWGYELIFTPEGLPYSGKIMHYRAGKRNSLQIHDKKIETGCLMSGECNLIIENDQGEMETIKMEQGKGYTVKVGQKHRYQGVTDCDIFEAAMSEVGVTFRLEDDYARGNEDDEMRKEENRGWGG